MSHRSSKSQENKTDLIMFTLPTSVSTAEHFIRSATVAIVRSGNVTHKFETTRKSFEHVSLRRKCGIYERAHHNGFYTFYDVSWKTASISSSSIHAVSQSWFITANYNPTQSWEPWSGGKSRALPVSSWCEVTVCTILPAYYVQWDFPSEPKLRSRPKEHVWNKLLWWN